MQSEEIRCQAKGCGRYAVAITTRGGMAPAGWIGSGWALCRDCFLVIDFDPEPAAEEEGS